MAQIPWEEKYLVGHERIDNEHKVFVDLVNNMIRAEELGFPKEKTRRLFSELKKYADFHFLSEENIMLDIDCPEYEEHQDEHRQLIARLEDHCHNYRAGKITMRNITEFLFEWFALHTTQVDKKLVDCLQAWERKKK